MRNIRKLLLVLSVVVSSMLSVAGAVSAADAGPVPVAVDRSAVSTSAALAWECPRGSFCVWEDTNGNGRRCNWDVADPDWWGGSVVCSWADDTPVESAWNNGVNLNFRSVEVFRGSNYGSRFACLTRGTQYNITAGGVILRSHRWATFTC